MFEAPKLPPITARSLEIYMALRNAALNAMRHGVLPNIAAALDAYDLLESKLASDDDDFDPGDRALLAEYHPQAIVLVEPAIAGMRQRMEEIYAIAQGVDVGFINAGLSPLFGVRMPEGESE